MFKKGNKMSLNPIADERVGIKYVGGGVVKRERPYPARLAVESGKAHYIDRDGNKTDVPVPAAPIKLI